MADHNFTGVEVPGPTIRPRSRGLLTDVTRPLGTDPARPTDSGERDYEPGSRVAAGVVFCSDGCGGLIALENTWCEETPLPEDYYEAQLSGPFDSFWVQADDLSPARYDQTHVRERLARRHRARFSAALAHELLTGDVTGGPSLQSAAATVVDGPTPIGESLFVIDELLAEYEGIEFTIHSSPGTFELLVATFDVTQDSQGIYRTATGHALIGDAGHDGSEAPDGYTSDTDGSWVYASTDVLTWESGLEYIGEESANFDRSRNTRSTVYGRHALVAFDECAVIAVQVEVPEYTATDGPGAPDSGS
jgi:hypothetical protein